MAGLGTRFQKAAHLNPEYLKPKPFISVKGEPMIRWATRSLPFVEHPGESADNVSKVLPKDLIFIILQDHDDRYEIEKQLRKIYSDDIKVIKLPEVTRGAAETAYQAKDLVDPDEEIIVSDSDHHFDGTELANMIKDKHEDTLGIIPVFTPPNDGIPRWSYSLVGDDKVIEKVAEKDRELMDLGAYANIGAYYFTRAKTFFDEVKEVIDNNILSGEEGKGEFYVAPIYQRIIEKGGKVQAAILPEVWGLGTPDDLENFLEKFENR